MVHSSHSFRGFMCNVNVVDMIQLNIKLLMAKANQIIKYNMPVIFTKVVQSH